MPAGAGGPHICAASQMSSPKRVIRHETDSAAMLPRESVKYCSADAGLHVFVVFRVIATMQAVSALVVSSNICVNLCIAKGW